VNYQARWCWPTSGAAHGLKAGTFVVTGSFTGFHPVELNKPVVGEFEGFGTMEATIVG
jgi:2-keto-4-pentenoate hydratase